nr:hypothetical protein HmN_000906800 [Hymenolepis microstoma]
MNWRITGREYPKAQCLTRSYRRLNFLSTKDYKRSPTPFRKYSLNLAALLFIIVEGRVRYYRVIDSRALLKVNKVDLRLFQNNLSTNNRTEQRTVKEAYLIEVVRPHPRLLLSRRAVVVAGLKIRSQQAPVTLLIVTAGVGRLTDPISGGLLTLPLPLVNVSLASDVISRSNDTLVKVGTFLLMHKAGQRSTVVLAKVLTIALVVFAKNGVITTQTSNLFTVSDKVAVASL